VVLATNYTAYTLEITPSKVSNLERPSTSWPMIDIQPRDRKRFKRLMERARARACPSAPS
jgi:penicillin-binding protein 2